MTYIVFIYFKSAHFNCIVTADNEEQAMQKGIARAKEGYGEEVYNNNIDYVTCRRTI